MIIFDLNINDRRIVNIKDLIAVFNSLKDGKHQLQIKDARKRSLPQNAYYWSVVVPMCRQGLYDAGYDEVRTNEDAHEVLKHVHLRRRIVSKSTGEVIDIAGETKKLTVPEFSNYLEAICKWAAEFLEIVIPSPNQAMIDYAEYASSMEQMVDE